MKHKDISRTHFTTLSAKSDIKSAEDEIIPIVFNNLLPYFDSFV